MTTRLRLASLLAVGATGLLLLAGATAPPARAATAGEWVKKLQAYYDATMDLDAEFTQETFLKVHQRKQTQSGRVRIKKPGMMRWDYVTPDPKLFVTDGQILWVYDPEDKQAMKQNLRGQALPSAVAFLYGKGNLASDFTISVVPEAKLGEIRPDGKAAYGLKPEGGVVLRLLPKVANARFKELYFVVHSASGQVTQTLMIEHDGGTNHITFRNAKLNSGLSEALFNWKPPAGTSILSGPGQ